MNKAGIGKNLLGTIVLLSVLLDLIEIVLGLSHSVSTGGGLGPLLVGVGSTLDVELGEVLEDSGLLDVSGVVVVLLLGISVADLLVFGGAQSSGNVRSSSDLSGGKLQRYQNKNRDCLVTTPINVHSPNIAATYVLLSTGTVVVLVLDRLEKIHVEDLYWLQRRERRKTRAFA